MADELQARTLRRISLRIVPFIMLLYFVAFIDRVNIGFASLTMNKDLGFTASVFGFGAGIFFWGYFLFEVPGSLIVEKWSARKWICRIMITWGIMAAMTAFVHCRIPGFTQVAELLMAAIVVVLKPLAALNFEWMGWFSWLLDWMPATSARLLAQFQGASGLSIFQFYSVRFLIGLAEAGFFPGIIVFLTHWFPVRDRTKALALFFVATPVAQIISPKISNALLRIGTDEVVNGVTVHHPEVLGLEGWQWVYVFWGIPAVALGFVVVFWLKDRPRDAKWLTSEERVALETQLEIDKAAGGKKRMTLMQALSHPLVLLLALAYFCNVTGTYGIEFFLPSILQQWYSLKLDAITWLIILPPILALVTQLFIGWNSDRTGERRCHAAFSIIIGLIALGLAPLTQGNLALTILCFMIFFAGVKGYQPAFWALPSLFLTESAAAGSIGLINSIGQIGGFMGPYLLGSLEKSTGSFATGIYVLTASMTVSAVIILSLGLGHRPKP